jgi:transposase InsO family protein
VPTWAGVAYVCFITDAFSRMIVGWRVARPLPHLRPSGGLRDYCAACIEETREHYRCPDCDSIVTVAVAEGAHAMYVDLRHDSTCPTWRAKSRKAL